MIPGAQAYTTKLNELVKMINSGLLVEVTCKQKHSKKEPQKEQEKGQGNHQGNH